MSLFRKSLASLPVLIVSLSSLSTGCRKCIPYLMQGAKPWDGHKPGTNLRRPVLSSLVGKGYERSIRRDRKSTRLNSSHGYISYAVFCLKKKKNMYASDRSTT